MTAIDTLQQRREQTMRELDDLLRIPSISALPDHAADVVAAADWVAHRLEAAGAEHVRVMPTGGHPVVYGDWLHAPGKPTILVYGHFDVQPVDPLELWTSPPFEPNVRNGRLYARGADDMKGNLIISIVAFEAMLRAGDLKVNMKFIFEGQEEIGSPQIPEFVAQNKDLLACDLVISGDGFQWSETQPMLLIALKGACCLEIDVQGARTDLHSGVYGGAVANPIHALVRILDSMRSPEGKILVEGFFDSVVPLTDEDRALIGQIPFDPVTVQSALAINGFFGEPGYTVPERLAGRPTLEINGIGGGFQGDGVKTVLPAKAMAKITCRIVSNQDPNEINELLVKHVAKHTPEGVTAVARPMPFSAKPYHIPRDHWANQIVASVLQELYQTEPLYVRAGATVPVTEIFLTHLNAYTVAFGFGMEDEMAHAPDEFLRISNFERGQDAWVLLLDRLGNRD